MAFSRKYKGSGFTLVELLVVIGIISVLVAILLPSLSKARAAANKTVCLSNIRQLGIGVIQYCQDNKAGFQRAHMRTTAIIPGLTKTGFTGRLLEKSRSPQSRNT